MADVASIFIVARATPRAEKQMAFHFDDSRR
jgi:hypothetical protein